MQLFFGALDFPLAYVVYKSGCFPKVLGAFLVIAGVGYLLDAFTHFLVPAMDFWLTVVVLRFGEILFLLWVVIMGAKFKE